MNSDQRSSCFAIGRFSHLFYAFVSIPCEKCKMKREVYVLVVFCLSVCLAPAQMRSKIWVCRRHFGGGVGKELKRRRIFSKYFFESAAIFYRKYELVTNYVLHARMHSTFGMYSVFSRTWQRIRPVAIGLEKLPPNFLDKKWTAAWQFQPPTWDVKEKFLIKAMEENVNIIVFGGIKVSKIDARSIIFS